MNLAQPLVFAPNRVWRLYTGGQLLDRFKAIDPAVDDHLPEEWLASTVCANNGEHALRADEGLGRVMLLDQPGPTLEALLQEQGVEILGKNHFAKYGANPAVLCKYLDSAIRLPIQCHPDAATAMKLFHSPFGKTECWHIIATRTIDGEPPYILLGFKPGVTAPDFARAVAEQDLSAIIRMLHKIPVAIGETYFVPARTPHAIGSGVFMLEVQEPSDWVIQVEEYCAGIRLNENDMWCSLPPERALEVFDYEGVSLPVLLSKAAPSDRIIQQTPTIRITELVGGGQTQAFGLWRAVITGYTSISLPTEFAVIVVESGSGTIRWSSGSREIKQGDYFLKPAALPFLSYETTGNLELLICLPPTVAE